MTPHPPTTKRNTSKQQLCMVHNLSPVPRHRMCRNSGREGEGPVTVANSGAPLLREWYQTRVPVAYICI